jgi:hypothetical protein
MGAFTRDILCVSFSKTIRKKHKILGPCLVMYFADALH